MRRSRSTASAKGLQYTDPFVGCVFLLYLSCSVAWSSEASVLRSPDYDGLRGESGAQAPALLGPLDLPPNLCSAF